MRNLRGLLAVLVVLAFVGVACGDDDDGGAVADPDTATTSDDASAAPPEYTITAAEDEGEYKFDMPSEIAGGVVTITLVNEGNKEAHDFQLVRIEDGHTIDELIPQLASEEAPLAEWLAHGAGVGGTPPGATSSATFELEPNAEYGFFCTESGDKGGHAEHGMAGSFTTGDDSGASLPEATATISTAEYTFKLDGLKAGKNTVAFTNDGAMLHHVAIVPFVEGKTLDDLKAAFESEDESAEPPVLFEQGIFSAVAGFGNTIVYEVDLEPGHYAVLCFMPDLGTAGPPHMIKGMLDEFEIT